MFDIRDETVAYFSGTTVGFDYIFGGNVPIDDKLLGNAINIRVAMGSYKPNLVETDMRLLEPYEGAAKDQYYIRKVDDLQGGKSTHLYGKLYRLSETRDTKDFWEFLSQRDDDGSNTFDYISEEKLFVDRFPSKRNGHLSAEDNLRVYWEEFLERKAKHLVSRIKFAKNALNDFW